MLHLDGKYWSCPQFGLYWNQAAVHDLTEAEIANVPWDRIFQIGFGFEDRAGTRVETGKFQIPFTRLSARHQNANEVWLTRSNFMAFAVGTHARLGNESPVLALAHAPELVAMIERFAMM